MKKLITILMFLFLIQTVNGQLLKFKAILTYHTDNALNMTKLNEITYLTFDFDKKLITIKSIVNTGNKIFTFKMITAVFEKGTMMGDCYKIKVSSYDLPEIIAISFNPEFPAIWMDTKNSTITYGGLTKIL